MLSCWEDASAKKSIGVAGQILHEGIVDGDDEDLACILELGAVDVAWDVGCGARGTFEGKQ